MRSGYGSLASRVCGSGLPAANITVLEFDWTACRVVRARECAGARLSQGGQRFTSAPGLCTPRMAAYGKSRKQGQGTCARSWSLARPNFMKVAPVLWALEGRGIVLVVQRPALRRSDE